MLNIWKDTLNLWAKRFAEITFDNPEAYKVYFLIAIAIGLIIFIRAINSKQNPTGALIIASMLIIASPYLFTFLSIFIFGAIKHLLYCIPTILILIAGGLVARRVKSKKGLDN